MASFQDGVGPGLFLPTTEIFDVQTVRQKDFSKEQLQEFIVRVVQAFNDSNTAVNLKDTGIYSLEEFVNGQTFFGTSLSGSQSNIFRQVFRKVINFGSLPNVGTKSVAHGITIDDNVTFTRIYGTASDTSAPREYIPLPFVDVSGTVTAGSVELHLDGTNINITTTGNGTNFNVCYVVLEYLKET